MSHCQFNSEEVELLREVLEHELREIDVEILRTDTHDFKELLKHRRTILEHMIGKLSEAPVVL